MKTRLTPLVLLFVTVISVCGDLDAWNNGTNANIRVGGVLATSITNVALTASRVVVAGSDKSLGSAATTQIITGAGAAATASDIATTLGYTPATNTLAGLTNVLGATYVNKVGDTMTGGLTVGSGATLRGAFVQSDGEFWVGNPYSSRTFSVTTASVGLSKDTALRWSDNASTAGTSDLFLYREAAATIQLGADAATATAQTVKAHDGSGTDKAGANLTLEGGQSTGTGRGGDVIHKTANSSTTGSSANTYSTRRYESAKFVDLTESTATLFANITCGTNNYVGAVITATVFATDGTELSSLTSQVRVDAVNKAGTVTAAISQTDNTAAATGGSTLTCAYTAVANGNGVDIKANAVSSLTQTTLRVKWIIAELNSNDAATVTPQ